MQKHWWKETVVYQVYPRSFMDSNGDGIGDLRGIIAKLDYLQTLGVGVVWLNPVYSSPNDDMGYDISDYRDIMAEFGTMRDFDELLSGLHDRGMRLIMDLVVNHTSDEHEWFIESRSSKDNPKRDYYIWRDGKDGKEPNNWLSYFAPSAWEYDSETNQYYLHLFSKKQPDLNWDSPAVRDEVYDLMNWWFDKGIDGFRMDVIGGIGKPDGLPDAGGVINPDGRAFPYCTFNTPLTHKYLQEMNRRVLAGRDIMTVGETGFITPEDAELYSDPDRRELNMVFSFEHTAIDGEGEKWNYRPWKLTEFKAILTKWQLEVKKGWNSLYFGNHDQPRSVSRFGNDSPEFRVASAKMLATALHMMRGTPYIYQGDEIGMTNIGFDNETRVRDVDAFNYIEQCRKSGVDEAQMWKNISYMSRDNSRTPMQWDNSANAGFSAGKPWISVNPNYTYVNVKASIDDENSVFHHYRKLIDLRKKYPTIVYGEYIPLMEDDEDVLAYLRKDENGEFFVICSFDGNTVTKVLPERVSGAKTLLLSNIVNAPGHSGCEINLAPYEANIYLL